MKIKKIIYKGATSLLLVLGSLVFCFVILEIACRVIPWSGFQEYQINNPYQYIKKIGKINKNYLSYYTYQEQVPLKFDFHSYYAPTNGLISFYSNQFGTRWFKPIDQNLKTKVVFVLGDSFTYGHGIHYEDTFVYQLEKKLEEASYPVSFFNFAKRGADSEKALNVYKNFKGRIKHDIILYGLHVNDLIHFDTSYVITNPPPSKSWLVEHSKTYSFIVNRIQKIFMRKSKIKELINPSKFEEPHFVKNLKALIMLNEMANNNGVRLYVVLLPVLVDLKKDSFRPLYEGIIKALDRNQIKYVDLTKNLNHFKDEDLWILPFDQHPNQKANKIFADRLFTDGSSPLEITKI